MVDLNGKHEGSIADALQEDATVGYLPIQPLEAMWLGGGDFPAMTIRRDIPYMELHPTVIAALEYYRSGTAGAEFWGGPTPNRPNDGTPDPGKPISPNPRVSQFVLAHAERYWQRGVPMVQEFGYPYGWAPGEHVYKESAGMLVWSHLKCFHPYDGHVLTLDYQPVGVRVKNVRQSEGGRQLPGGEVDLWFAADRVPAKAAWYAHRPRGQQFYGRTQLAGGWRPWRRLAWRDAVEQVIDAAIYRAGYRGPIVKHPREDMQTAREGVPATVADARGQPRRSARDVARQMVEWAKAGAGFTLPSENYPQANGGGPKWVVEWPDHVMDVRPLIEGARYLEEQVMLGIGVPPELVKAGGTGSGYSGRSIPREAFLDQQQRVADAMLQQFVEQVVRPLVLWNFGDVPFNVQCKPLLKSQAENKQGQPKPPLPQDGQGQQPGQPGQPGGPPPMGQPSQGPPSAGMSLSGVAVEIARRVLRRVAA